MTTLAESRHRVTMAILASVQDALDAGRGADVRLDEEVLQELLAAWAAYDQAVLEAALGLVRR